MSASGGGKKLLLRKLLLSLTATVVTLVGLEVVSRIYIAWIADREQFSKYASLEQYNERVGGEEWWFGLLAPHRYLGYVLAPNLTDGKNRHNSLGYRGEEITQPKPEGEFRIACLGASTTYSLLVPDASRSYPALLQRKLRARGHERLSVVNAGVPAWTSYENLINYLLRVEELHPDLIILKTAFADVVCRMVWPPSAFEADNSGCLAPRLTRRDTPLYLSSALLRILLVGSGQALPTSALGASVYNQAETSYFFEFARQRFTLTYPTGIFREVSVAQMLEANSSAHYRHNVESLLIQARARGVQAVLMTFPYTPLVPAYFDVEGFRAGVDAHNDILRDIATTMNVPLIDMAKVFPNDLTYWGFDGIHANEAGTELESQIVTDFLLEHGLIDQKPNNNVPPTTAQAPKDAGGPDALAPTAPPLPRGSAAP